MNAPGRRRVVFVRGTTEATNLVAQSWGREHVGEGDEIVVSWLEHSSNLVPWQRLAAETRATLRIAPIDDRGQIVLDEYDALLGHAPGSWRWRTCRTRSAPSCRSPK